MTFRHLALGLVAFALVTPPALAARAKVGRQAPAFDLVTYDKRKVAFAELKGKVIVINHWATWCGPCKAEMPMMSAFHRRYRAAGFEIFGVTTEDSVPEGKLKAVAAALSYPLVRRFNGAGYPVLDGVPTTYVIDRAGVVRYAHSGAFETAEFMRLILPLLAEKPPAP
jgi:peroxiredoxin